MTEQEITAMKADMDRAAADFWAYPGEEWQLGFQADWLRVHGFDRQAAEIEEVLQTIKAAA